MRVEPEKTICRPCKMINKRRLLVGTATSIREGEGAGVLRDPIAHAADGEVGSPPAGLGIA